MYIIHVYSNSIGLQLRCDLLLMLHFFWPLLGPKLPLPNANVVTSMPTHAFSNILIFCTMILVIDKNEAQAESRSLVPCINRIPNDNIVLILFCLISHRPA